MKKVLTFAVLAPLVGALVGLWLVEPWLSSRLEAQGPRSPRQFHVSGLPIPSSAASPAALEGGTLNTDVNVDFLVISNTDSSSHTVTIVDCTAVTPFTLFNASPIAALTVWPVPLGGMRFKGCFKWSASSTTVMGGVTGTR